MLGGASFICLRGETELAGRPVGHGSLGPVSDAIWALLVERLPEATESCALHDFILATPSGLMIPTPLSGMWCFMRIPTRKDQERRRLQRDKKWQ